MSSDIKHILEKFQALEGKLTPVGVKHGLNPQQKSVKQLPALFKPRHISALTNKTDPQHPAKNYFVGAESKDIDDKSVDEDVLSKVKKGLNDYLKTVEDELHGASDLQKRKPDTRDLKKPEDRKDRDILPKLLGTISKNKMSNPVKTFHFEDGKICEIHGDEDSGFGVRHMGKELPSRFDSLNDAELAMQMYQARKSRLANKAMNKIANPDYIDEA